MPAGRTVGHTDGMPAAASCRTLRELLDLDRLDRDLYRGFNDEGAQALPRLYGGQVAAQALRAASLTVGDDRRVHSLHGYFLRPGRHDLPVILRVERDRDGRSFSARHVEAVQDGEVILTLSASFHVAEDSPDYVPPGPSGVPGPNDPSIEPFGWHISDIVDVRSCPVSGTAPGGRLWARVREDLGDDPAVQACALAYLSDFGTGFASGPVAGLPIGGPTLDHSLWYHAPIRADRWVLVDLWPLKAGAACGLYNGALRDADDTLGALLSQEILLRPEGGGAPSGPTGSGVGRPAGRDRA